MYAHERSLVERYQEKPFALLGVNTDPLADVKNIYEKNKISWRSWVQGSTEGPVPIKWDIQTWPTIFLIDHRGIIRHRLGVVSPHQLDALIEELMSEVE